MFAIETTSEEKPKDSTKEKDPVLSALRDIQSQIGNLNKDVSVLQANAQTQRTEFGKCKKCQESKVDRCYHCFRCESNDHYSRGCKVASNSSSD